MPSLIDLRRRIRAVKSTQQITKAMKMIAASRLRRAQDRVVAPRPRAPGPLQGADRPGAARAARAGSAEGGGRRRLCFVTPGDRGLSSSFNSNVIKAAGQFIVNEGRG